MTPASDSPAIKLSLHTTRLDGAAVLEAARACERHGVDALWLDESLWYRGALPLAAAAGAMTQKLRIGIGVLNPYVMHPSVLAMNYGALAELTGGRAVLALGSGVARWLEQLGIDYSRPRTTVKEAVEVMRGLLGGERVTHEGKAFTVKDVALDFEPVHRAPIFMGAMGERTVKTCGAVADGWVISIMEPLRYVELRFEQLRAGAEEAGRSLDDFEVVQYFPFACDPDAEQARRQVKQLIATIFRLEFEFCRGQEAMMDALSAHLQTVSRREYGEMMKELAGGASPDAAIPDSFVAEIAIAGTPDQCAAQLQEYARLGITEAALLPADADVEAATRAIGTRLRPSLQAAPIGAT